LRSKIATSNEYKKGTQAEQRQIRGGQEWGLRRRNVGPRGEQVRKGEGLAVKGQQYKAGWEGCQE
jgi:hypothetical protein